MCRYVPMCLCAACLASHIRVRTHSKSLRCIISLFRVKNSMSCVYQAETGIFSHSPCEQYGTIPEHDMSGPLIVGIFGQLVAILSSCRPSALPACQPSALPVPSACQPTSLLFGPLHYQRSLIAQINTNYLSTM